MRSIQVIVHGRVQRVGFRWFVRDRAVAHAVTGWVRNRADGAVEAVLCGEDAAVEALVAAIRNGPTYARVTGAEISDTENPGVTGFEIRS